MPLISIFTLADREPESNNGCDPLGEKSLIPWPKPFCCGHRKKKSSIYDEDIARGLCVEFVTVYSVLMS